MKSHEAQNDAAKFEKLKQGMKASWMAGDFGQIAKYSADEAAEFIARLPIHDGIDVLDVACGTGNLTIPAARAGARVAGVDIASNLVEQARERAAAENLTIDFRIGDAEALPFANSSFDMVVTMFGAMFAPRPEVVAAELARVCRPGGMIAMDHRFRSVAPSRLLCHVRPFWCIASSRILLTPRTVHPSYLSVARCN